MSYLDYSEDEEGASNLKRSKRRREDPDASFSDSHVIEVDMECGDSDASNVTSSINAIGHAGGNVVSSNSSVQPTKARARAVSEKK